MDAIKEYYSDFTAACIVQKVSMIQEELGTRRTIEIYSPPIPKLQKWLQEAVDEGKSKRKIPEPSQFVKKFYKKIDYASQIGGYDTTFYTANKKMEAWLKVKLLFCVWHVFACTKLWMHVVLHDVNIA